MIKPEENVILNSKENELCGHSLEEAIRNVNRSHYGLSDSPTEDDLEFSGKCKTDFALKLIYECTDYNIPAYIKSGLIWLNDQRYLNKRDDGLWMKIIMVQIMN